MQRVIILGRGASGKSTLARRLGEVTDLPVVELDKIFWQPGLVAMPRADWIAAQEQLVSQERWIMDGDLGPFDAIETRLRAADTVIFLGFSWLCCARRAFARSRERMDFWWWLLAYPWKSRPRLMEAIASYARDAELYVFRDPGSLERFVDRLVAFGGN